MAQLDAVKDGSNKMNKLPFLANGVLNIWFMLWSLVCILPLILVISVSLTDEKTITLGGYQFIPQVFSTYAYSYIFTSGGSILRSYFVTICITVIGTVLSVLLIAMYAYPISRKDFRYRNHLSFFVFFTMIFNGGLVPWYMVLTQLVKVSDSYLAYIFPMAVNAWYIIIMKTFFQTTVPESIIESAKLDGAGEFRTFWQIVMPLSKPGLATVALFQTLAFWNDWFNPLMYIEDGAKYNLQYMLYRLMINIQNLQDIKGGVSIDVSKLPGETARMAMCVLAVGPIVAAYPFFQKYFIAGLTVGAVKG